MAKIRTLLIADADPLLCDTLFDQLNRQGEFRVLTVNDPVALQAAAEAETPDAIILDAALARHTGSPGVPGLRRRAANALIIILADAVQAAAVSLSGSGADDVLIKPFRVKDLLARLRAGLDPVSETTEQVLPLGPFRFLPDRKRLEHPGAGRRPIRLTEKETAILRYLAQYPGATVKRETLLREIWGYSADSETRTVEAHIQRLRRKIDPVQLVGEAKGYRLVA